jgi:hypothetical protein
MSVKTISIHGSCITRDTLAINENRNLKLKLYIARHCIISAISEAFNIKEDDKYINNIKSTFQKNMVLNDLNKTLFESLKSNKSDFLIIDLLDERFSIVDVMGKYITYSNEFKSSNMHEYIGGNIIKKVDLDDELISNYMNVYIDKILEIYDEENIIINKVYHLDKYIDNYGNIVNFNDNILRVNKINNKVLDKHYYYLENRLKKSKFIDITKNYLADSNQKWGLAPYHYEYKYYKDSLDIIKGMIFN